MARKSLGNLDLVKAVLDTNTLTIKSIQLSAANQGQARGYGRITHFLPLPTWGHDFPWAIVTQPVGIFQTTGCHSGLILVRFD